MKTTKSEPITRAEMARELERLKEVKVEDRYTISDMAILTGWTPEYLYKLEKTGLIPKAGRVTKGPDGKDLPLSGNPDFCKRGKLLGPRRWSEDQARAIIGFRRGRNGG